MLTFLLLIVVFTLLFWIIFDKLKYDSDEINKLHDEMHKDTPNKL